MSKFTKFLKVQLLYLGIILFPFSFLESCTENKAADIPVSAEKYQVITPVKMDTSIATEYVADIHSLKNVELRARVKGYLDKIFVDEGQAVKKGQVLFSISKQEYNEDLLKAKANLKSAIADAKAAELDVKNEKILVDKKVVSLTDLDMAQSKLDALNAAIDEARSNVASAELNLSYTEIKAPFYGVIDRIPNKTGSLIDEGTLLTTISDNSEVFAYFNVPEQEYLDMMQQKENDENNSVQLILANNETYPYKGKIETVESEIDKSTGNIAFRARFQNPEHILKNGSSGKLVLQKQAEDAIVIPQKCSFEVQDKNFVYVVDGNHTVHLRSITPKYRFTNYYVVDGLSVNDKILYEGIQLVKQGDKINPEFIPFNQVKRELAQL
jgi:membrane fusion protein (multidrug efflux system)